MLESTKEQAVEPEEWVQVGHYPSLQEAYDHGLVVLAMGEACRVAEAETPGEFELQAEVVPAPRVAEELDVYGRELADVLPTPAFPGDWGRRPAGLAYGAVWAAALIAVFFGQMSDPRLVELGASSNLAFFDNGEWWRPFTALFLHADLAHLTGNLASGFLFAALVSKVVGPIRGWLAILLCGTLGNIATAWMHYPEVHISLGASTAVFGALGILSGHGLAEMFRYRAGLPWARVTAPIVGGFILLGWLGSGGGAPNTDVMAHVFGFGSGVVAGVVLERVGGEMPALET